MPARREKHRTDALNGAVRVIAEATRVGFQWKDWVGPLKKVKEELRELESEIRSRRPDKKRIAGEIGDLLFSVCNLATRFGLKPDRALSSTLKKFRMRFRYVEAELKKRGRKPEASNLKEMGDLWDEAKRRTKKR